MLYIEFTRVREFSLSLVVRRMILGNLINILIIIEG